MTELSTKDIEIQGKALKMGDALVPYDALIEVKLDQGKVRKIAGGSLILVGVLLLVDTTNGWIGWLGVIPIVLGYVLWGDSSTGPSLKIMTREGHFRVKGQTLDDLNHLASNIGRAVANLRGA